MEKLRKGKPLNLKTLFYNAKVWLGKKYFANTLGFDDVNGKITYVSNELPPDLSEYKKMDLECKLVLPAFMDGHCHLFKGSQVNSEIDLRYAKTKNEFAEKISEYKKYLKPSKWIIGGYFSETNFTEDFQVNKNLLDEMCNDVPTVLFRTDLHTVICNSLALELINPENNSDLNEEEIIRNDDGSLTGELKERAMYYAMKFFPEVTQEENMKILETEFKKLNSYGITSVTDISLKEDLHAYKYYFENNDLMRLKINSVVPFKEFNLIEYYKKEFTDFKDYIKFGSIKAFYDGSLSSHSALFYDNYKGTDYNGLRTEMVKGGSFKKIGIESDLLGYQIVVHAIGDLAVSELLDFAEELSETNGIRDRRFRIEHAQHIIKEDVKRFKKNNVIASIQPAHLFFDAKVAEEYLTKPETTHIFKDLIDEGVKTCFGTDFPVVPENPFHTIYMAMTRKATGYPDGYKTEYALSLIDCLEGYTINNAYASYQEKIMGSITKGKFADLIITDRDIFNISPEEIRDTKILNTYLNGKLIYES